MLSFISIAVLITIAVLWGLLKPLFKGHQQQQSIQEKRNIFQQQLLELEQDKANALISDTAYTQAKIELQRRMITELDNSAQDNNATQQQSPADRQLGITLAISLPIIAALLYWQFGSVQVIQQPALLNQPIINADNNKALMSQVNKMVASLKAKLEKQPNNPQGWVMLAKSYTELNRYQDALPAYEKAIQQNPNNATLMADYADVLALVNQHQFDPKTFKLVEQALMIEPNHLKALMLATTIAFAQADYPKAILYLERLNTHLPPDSPIRPSVKSSLTKARHLLAKQ